MKLSKQKIRERDKRRFNELIREKERMGRFFTGNEELYFLRDKHNFNRRSIKSKEDKMNLNMPLKSVEEKR